MQNSVQFSAVRRCIFLGNRVKELRTNKKMTLKEFTSSFNDYLKDKYFKDGKIKKVSYATISRWENSKSEPQREMWEKLANYFNVDVAYLQGLVDIKNQQEYTNRRENYLQKMLSKGDEGLIFTDDEWSQLVSDLKEQGAYANTHVIETVLTFILHNDIKDGGQTLDTIMKEPELFDMVRDYIFSSVNLFLAEYFHTENLSSVDRYKIKKTLTDLSELNKEIHNKLVKAENRLF